MLFMTMGALTLGTTLQSFIVNESGDMEDKIWIWTRYGTAFRALYTMYEITMAGNWMLGWLWQDWRVFFCAAAGIAPYYTVPTVPYLLTLCIYIYIYIYKNINIYIHIHNIHIVDLSFCTFEFGGYGLLVLRRQGPQMQGL